MNVPGNAQQTSHTRKQVAALLDLSIKGIREKVATFIGEAIGGAHVLAVSEKDQVVGFLHRQSLEQHRIQQTEDRRIRADAKRESENCDISLSPIHPQITQIFC